MSKAAYKVGDIIKNSIGQFTKVIGITNGTMYALSGWTNLKSAKEATVATIFLNIYGLEACEATKVSSTKASDEDHSSDDEDEESDEEGDEDQDGDDEEAKAPTKSSLAKMSAEAVKELAESLEIETEGLNKNQTLELLYTHYEL